MNVEREVLVDWGVPIVATLLFIAAVAAVGFLYNTDGLSGTGALALVGVIVAFILGMAVIGILTAEEEDEGDED